MSKIKLVHVQLLPLLSGVQRVSLSEIEYLKNYHLDQYEFHMIVSAHGPFTDACTKLGVTIHIAPNLVRHVSPLNDIRALMQIYNLFRNLKPDIVHTHSSKSGLLGRIAAKLAKTPHIIHTIHGFAFDGARNIFAKAFYFACEFIAARLCDKLIVMNSSDRVICENALLSSKKKIHFIPNGIDISRYSINNHRPNSPSASHIKVGFLGRLSEQKNPIILLEAFEMVRRSTRQDLKLKFIGDGEMRGEILQRARDLGVSDCVEITGWVDRPEAHLASLDIYVQPSNWEGMPLAVLEAAASGLPIICSDIPGNHDIIHDKKSGLLFKKDNKESLADALLSLVSDGKLRTDLGEIVRRHVVEFYSSHSHGKNIKSLYDDRRI